MSYICCVAMDPHRTLPVYEGQKKTISILIPTFLLLFFLSVVLWILSMTARMSKNIHDDHSSFWVSLDDSARLSEWYNDIDVCLLSSPFTSAPTIADYAQDGTRHSGSIRHNKTKTDIQLQRKVLVDLETNWSHRCAKDFRTARKEVPFFCRISNCNLPLFRRHFHLKELNSKLIRSPRKSLIYHLYSLAEAEHALVFIGDTVTKQVRQCLELVYLLTRLLYLFIYIIYYIYILSIDVPYHASSFHLHIYNIPI